jgi:hypothetical protein
MSSNRQIMKMIKKIAKVLLITCLVLFASLFIYANWNKPSLGEKVYMENPTQILVMTLPENFTEKDSAAVDRFLSGQEGVYSTVISRNSQTLCITFDPRETNRSGMIETMSAYSTSIRERAPLSNRAECPVNLNAFRKITYALNVRK